MVDNITHKNTLKLLSCPLAPLVHSTFQFVQGTKLTPPRSPVSNVSDRLFQWLVNSPAKNVK